MMTDTSSHPAPGGVFMLAGRPVPRMGYGMGQITRRAVTAEDRAGAVVLLRRAFDLPAMSSTAQVGSCCPV